MVLSFCMLLANNVKICAQPTISFSASDGNALTVEDVEYTLMRYSSVDKSFNSSTSPFHALIGGARAVGISAFALRPILSVKGSVAEVAEGAFNNCPLLSSVELPSTQVIGNLSFAGCPSLTRVLFPAVDVVTEGAFLKCDNLYDVSFPVAHTIEAGAFAQCPKLVLLNFPEVLHIEACAFMDCTSLTDNVEFPQVTYIWREAFLNCTSLTAIKCPKLKSLSTRVFANCKSLIFVTAPELEAIGRSAFWDCESLFKNIPRSLYESLVDFKKVKELDVQAFWGCSSIKVMDLPAVETIGEGAFKNCSSLEYVYCPNIKKIEASAFGGCSALMEIVCPAVVTIGAEAFSDCSSLFYIDFSKVTTVGVGAFNACAALDTLKLPKCASIEMGAFTNCTSLQAARLSVIQSIGMMAFANCPNLKYVSFGAGHTKAQIIRLEMAIFGYGTYGSNVRSSSGIELVLGEYVLPKPTNNSWNGYTWNSITVVPAEGISGIKEVIKNGAVDIYPNPAKETATVNFELEKAGDVKIALVDMSGKEVTAVYKGFTPAGMFIKTFGTGHLPAGVYLLNILIDGDTIVKKIVLRRD